MCWHVAAEASPVHPLTWASYSVTWLELTNFPQLRSILYAASIDNSWILQNAASTGREQTMMEHMSSCSCLPDNMSSSTAITVQCAMRDSFVPIAVAHSTHLLMAGQTTRWQLPSAWCCAIAMGHVSLHLAQRAKQCSQQTRNAHCRDYSMTTVSTARPL